MRLEYVRAMLGGDETQRKDAYKRESKAWKRKAQNARVKL